MKNNQYTKKQTEEMSELFDTDTSIKSNNSRVYDNSFDNYDDNYNEETDGSRSFEDKCNDIKYIMESESTNINMKVDNDDDNSDYNNVNSNDVDKLQDIISKGTQHDKITKIHKSDPTPHESLNHENLDNNSKKTDNVLEKEFSVYPDSLVGSDLKFYNEVKDKYKQFNLYDGSIAFQGFYHSKLKQLKNLLGRYPIIDTLKLSNDLHSIKLDHTVGDNEVHPELIRYKIDSAQKHRIRVTTILVEAYEQFFIWERILELLRGKLWKDHHTKGAEKRDGLVLEHLVDMEEYVAKLKGIIEAAKKLDNFLVASSDSLSRQLSCLDMKEKTGFSVKMGPERLNNLEHSESVKINKDKSLNKYDELEENITINEFKHTGNAQKSSFGSTEKVNDDLNDIGM